MSSAPIRDSLSIAPRCLYLCLLSPRACGWNLLVSCTTPLSFWGQGSGKQRNYPHWGGVLTAHHPAPLSEPRSDRCHQWERSRGGCREMTLMLRCCRGSCGAVLIVFPPPPPPPPPQRPYGIFLSSLVTPGQFRSLILKLSLAGFTYSSKLLIIDLFL